MKLKLLTLLSSVILLLSGVCAKAQDTSVQQAISEIKLNNAYITSTGTAKTNGEAMEDARNRLKSEIFDWLSETVPATSSKDPVLQAYRDIIHKKVKIEKSYHRNSFSDSLKVYAGVIAQGDDVKFLDRKAGDYLRVFAYISKDLILPGIIPQVEPAPEEPVGLEEKQETAIQVEEVQEVEEAEIIPESESVAPQGSQASAVLQPDENIVKSLLEIRTASELNKYLLQLKNQEKLADMGTSLPSQSNDGGSYVILYDSHKVIRSKLWYNGEEFIDLNNNQAVNFRSLYDAYSNIVWFKTK